LKFNDSKCPGWIHSLQDALFPAGENTGKGRMAGPIEIKGRRENPSRPQTRSAGK
jgi:hypothetical protein